MRARLGLLAVLLVFTTSGFAKDVYLSIGGSVGKFRTDARIFNPSFTKDITITARYLPTGNNDNSGVATKNIIVAKRSMAVYDDVVQSLFGGGAPLGAVRLTSDDDFVATQRIYADESDTPKNGTLGQFVPGLDVNTAKTKGVLIQLRSNGSPGQKGTFRTNWGAVNPNSTTATINFTLHDVNNSIAGTNTLTLQPFGVFFPGDLFNFFGNPNRDLSNAWVSFTSDHPVFLFASVLDNGTEDPTFIPASEDSGVAPTPEPEPQLKTVQVTAQNWFFVINASSPLRPGDRVRFLIRSSEDVHGFSLFTPSGQILINEGFVDGIDIERIVTIPSTGTYTYVCAFSGCGTGHTSMNGTFTVNSN